MAKKKSPFLQKLSNLLKLSIFLAKLKKPTIPKLIFLKKTRRAKEFKLLDHYQFSPSSTPLIRFRGKFPRKGKISFRKVYANMLLISECLGRVRDEGEKEIYCFDMGLENFQIDLTNSCIEDDCVDERAERFIERFYEEMRRQRHESNFQMNSMVEM